MTGCISKIQPFSVYDGPGIRSVVFLKGCSLRCFWCHNPETQSKTPVMAKYAQKCISCGECINVCPNSQNEKTALFTPECTVCGKCSEVCFAEAIEKIGKEVTSDEIIKILLKDKQLYEESNGGVTFSGGEPLLQTEFLYDIMSKCNKYGIHTAIETALFASWDKIEKLVPVCDHFICDFKTADNQKHSEATGAENGLIIENLKKLAKTGKLKEVRTPVIPGFNDTDEDILAIWNIVKSLEKNIKYSLLPFCSICESKYKSQGRKFLATGIKEPSKEKMAELNNLLK
ncbi:MAG: glycyl-radical enzyme activating protein [Clostridia bacterium]|nr:glycyl-radical enzyme activating protein [Clostridia bacterium]